MPSRGAVVLIYHSIGDNKEFFTVYASEFEKQMKYLADNNYRVISASTMAGLLGRGQEVSPKTVVITFDDGYEDNYTNAFPVLKKYGFLASIFLTTGSLAGTRTTSKGTVISTLHWPQIKEMADSGLIEFFPHTHTHPKLNLLSDDKVLNEVHVSKEIMEKELNKKMDIFAYPYGKSNQKVRDVLKQEGFKVAFTVETGPVTAKVDPLLINRNSIDSMVTLSMFKGIIKRGRI